MSLSKQTRYLEFEKKNADEGSVWKYFLRAEDSQTAKCKQCSKILKTLGGATTALHTHLKSIHTIIVKKKNECSPAGPSTKKQKGMTDYIISSNEMDVMVARMAAVDGLPFSKFCTSVDLRALFSKCGYKLPESGTAIKQIVLKQHEVLKKQLKKEITEDESTCYSVTLDEYTSIRNRRYMNVNIHSEKFDDKITNLGLVRICGSMPATSAYGYLEGRLDEFAVKINTDVVCLTSDGASVMVKMGRYFEGAHQLCLAHGIQLGVIDYLYQKKTNEHIHDLVQENSSNDESEVETDHEDHDTGFNVDTMTAPNNPDLNFKDLIEKVRKVVRSVRKSSLKNDAIQNYVKNEFGTEMNLILDCKTRWSSLSDMIGRFLKLKSAIAKGFLDFDIAMPINERSLVLLKQLHDSLDVVKTTVESLCQRDADLMKADMALKFMMKSLDEQNNGISQDLAKSLRKRIKERRINLASILSYLYESEYYHQDNFDLETFKKPTSDEMLTEMIKLLNRLDKSLKVQGEHRGVDEDGNENLESIEVQKTLKQKLQDAINKRVNASHKEGSSRITVDLESLLRVEMAVFENGGSRGKYLTKCFEYLKTIPPTSVEAERAFSAVTYTCNRLRSSLNDDSLDALCFLKFHYQNK